MRTPREIAQGAARIRAPTRSSPTKLQPNLQNLARNYCGHATCTRATCVSPPRRARLGSHQRMAIMRMKSELSKPRRLHATSVLRTIAMLGLCAAAFSCEDGHSKRSNATPVPPTDLSDPNAEFALHMFVATSDGMRRVDVPPLRASDDASAVPWMDEGPPATAEGLEDILPSGYTPPAPAPEPGGAPPKPKPAGPPRHPPTANPPRAAGTDLDRQEAWETVLRYFAAECGHGTNPLLGESGVAGAPWDNQPGGGPSTYLFPKATTCDQVLAYQEAALCIAERMTAVADAVDTVTLQAGTAEALVIPPQAQRDRFIVRDVAMNALAAVALMDMTKFQAIDYLTCSAGYAQAQSWQGNTAKLDVLFGGQGAPPYFPPADVTPTTADGLKRLAQSRLNFEAQILRSASRLLEKLVRDSVYGDMSTAAERRATAPDPVEGARRAWGVTPLQLSQLNGALVVSAPSSYGSLAHAVRATHGRLNLGPAQPDPKCGGLGAMELLTTKAYGSEMLARVDDRPVVTAGQRASVAMLQKSGIVIPASALAQENAPTIRAAVTAQAIATAAEDQGITDLAAFTAWGQGASIKATFDALKDEDIRFGLDRNFRRYQMLTGSSGSIAAATAMAGLTTRTALSQVTGPLHGIVLANGITTGDTCGSTPAHSGGIQVASQCDESGGLVNALKADFAETESHQDALSLAQTLGRRLVVLRERAMTQNLTESYEVANVAAAEVRAWGGQGRITVTATAKVADPTSADTTTVYLNGFDPLALGATTAADMGANVALVYGEPWVADCAARLRTACPETFQDDYVKKPSLNEVFAANPAISGLDGSVVKLTFAETSTQFAPKFAEGEEAAATTKRLYAVLLHDPDQPSRGRVLGAVALRKSTAAGGAVSFPVSMFQRKLLNDVVGCEEGGDASQSPSYCIEGVPRDLFVPLENELTSDSDSFENSWRHYLGLAKSAALEADSLAKEMIAIGEQQDLRREGAMEAVAAECGQYVNIGDVPIVGGQVQAPKDDGALAACLDDAKVDVVFLGTDEIGDSSDDDDNPEDGLVDNEQQDLEEQAKIRQAIACLDTNPNDMQYKAQETNPICRSGKPITHAGLGLVKNQDLQGPDPGEREKVLAVVASLQTGFDQAQMAQLIPQSWASSEHIASVLQQTKLFVEPNGDFRLMVNGRKRMDSGDEEFWPACLNASQPCTASNQYVEFLNALFAPGQCYDDAVRDRILWQLEGALWTLASVAGVVPQDLFHVPIVARDFVVNGGDDAPVLTVYGSSKFTDYGRLMDPEPQPNEMGDTGEPWPLFVYSNKPDVPQWLQTLAADIQDYKVAHPNDKQPYRLRGASNPSMRLREKPEASAEWKKLNHQTLSWSGCGTPANPAGCDDPGLKVTDVLLCAHGNAPNALDPTILRIRSSASGFVVPGDVAVDFPYILQGTANYGESDPPGYRVADTNPVTDAYNPHVYGFYARRDPDGSYGNMPPFPFGPGFEYDSLLDDCWQKPNPFPAPPSCIHALSAGMPQVTLPCAQTTISAHEIGPFYATGECPAGQKWGFNLAANLSPALLRPTTCPPGARVPAFVNSYAPRVAGSGAWQAVQAFGLAYLYGDPRAVVIPLGCRSLFAPSFHAVAA